MEGTTRTITCRNCSSQFKVDFSKAPKDVFTVACPKCGQKYQLKKPVPRAAQAQTAPTRAIPPVASLVSTKAAPSATPPEIDLSQFNPRSGWEYNLYQYTRMVPYAKHVTLSIYGSKLVSSIANIVKHQAASGSISPSAYAAMKANISATCSVIYSKAIAPELVELGIPRFMQKPFAARFTKSLAGELSSSLVSIPAATTPRTPPSSTKPANVRSEQPLEKAPKAPVLVAEPQDRGRTPPPSSPPPPLQSTKQTADASSIPPKRTPIPTAMWVLGLSMIICCFLPWIEMHGSWDFGVGGRGSMFLGAASGSNFWQGQLCILLVAGALIAKQTGQRGIAGFCALLVTMLSVHFFFQIKGIFEHSFSSSDGGYSASGSLRADPGLGLIALGLLSIPFFNLCLTNGWTQSFARSHLATIPVEPPKTFKARPAPVSAELYSAEIGESEPKATAPNTPVDVTPSISPSPAPETAPAKPAQAKLDKSKPASKKSTVSVKSIVIVCAAVLFCGLTAWWFFDLRHRHTLTATERAQADGWFKDIAARQDWVMVRTADDVVPEQGVAIKQPVVTADAKGNVSISLAIVLEAYAQDFGYGRFQTVVQRRYDKLTEPEQVELCNADPDYGSKGCLTWQIINPDSMSIELQEEGGASTRYAVISSARFYARQQAVAQRQQERLVQTVDSIAQGLGMVRQGSFSGYSCGNECSATFLEVRNGESTPIAYLCNTNRFGDVQLSTGDMIGEGDFTNKDLVGKKFLIVSKQMNLPDAGPAWVVMGLLPFSNDQLSSGLQQRLALSANFDAGTPLAASENADYGGISSDKANATYDANEVQQQPAFKGGAEAMYDYLKHNTKYPEAEFDAGIQGKVYIEFVVDKDGSVRDVKVRRGVSPGLDREAVRAVSSMPRWTPGYLDGRAVKCRYTIPVSFALK